MKGRCPSPLDDRDLLSSFHSSFYQATLRVASAEEERGAKRDRTAGLLHAMQVLSQLSYSPSKTGHFMWVLYSCQS